MLIKTNPKTLAEKLLLIETLAEEIAEELAQAKPKRLPRGGLPDSLIAAQIVYHVRYLREKEEKKLE